MKRRVGLAVLAAVLIVGLAGVAVAAGDMAEPSSVELDRVEPPSGQMIDTTYPEAPSDLGLASTIGDANLRTAFEQAEFEARIARAEDADAAERITDEYLANLDGELTDLHNLELTRHAAFRTGEEDLETFVRAIVILDARAQARITTFDSLRAMDQHVPQFLGGKITDLRERYEMYAGPVRELMTAEVTTQEAAPPILLETSDAGLTLATVHEGQYHREAVRYDHFDRTPDPEFDLAEDAIVIAAEAYPESNLESARRAAPWLYTVQLETAGGQIAAYVSSGSEEVFLERQHLWPHMMTLTDSSVHTEGGYTLTVNRTFSTGPMELIVVDEETGEPVDATISLQIGERTTTLGTTDRTSLWTVEPRPAFDIEVVVDNETYLFEL